MSWQLAVEPHPPADSSSLRRLPVALSHPVATVMDTSATLVALPGRIIDLVAVVEQTLTALRVLVLRTNASLQRAEDITGTVEEVIRDADRAVTAAAGTVEKAHSLTDSTIALLGAYSDALNRLAPTVRRLAVTLTRSDPFGSH